MNALQRYRITLGVGCLVLAAAGWIYADIKEIAPATALPVIIAFLAEFCFYLLPGFPDVWRSWRERSGRLGTIALLTFSGVAPWLLYSIPTGLFIARNLLLLSAIALVVSLVYARGKVSPARDTLFLILLAGFILYRFFDRIYLSPIPKLQISILGHLMLIRIAALSLYGLRGGVAARFWFLPSALEWATGLKWFALAILPLTVAGWATGSVRVRDNFANPLSAVATFFGILWVVALSEEFFFRGLIQQWLEKWTSNDYVALIIAAALFGSVHLSFHGVFPNWRFSLVAAVLGLFCGLAWRERRSVQASMVTHALAASAFRIFFR